MSERIRNILRWAYFPYTWLVVAPFLAVSTMAWGVVAVLLCLVSPRLAFYCGVIWSWCICRMNFTCVSVNGRANVEPGRAYVIMSNHQSHFDALVFYGHFGAQFRWVLKDELRRVPGLGWYCVAGGHIFVDRSDHEKAIASLKAAKPLTEGGISVMFFPEGTRSRDGRLGQLKKGGFMMAMGMSLPILPVSISGSRHILPGKRMMLLPGHVRIQIHSPIDTTKYGVDGRDQLMADVRASIGAGLTPWERGESGNVPE